MIKSLLARISATIVFVFLISLLPQNQLVAQIDISGSICEDTTLDNINDGISATGDDAYAGVTVLLYDCSSVLVATTVTDASGDYEFTGLTGTCYDLLFSTPTGFCVVPNSVVNSTGAYIGTITGDQTVDVCFTQEVSVAGYAFDDSNGDGIMTGEAGEGIVVVTITGTDPFYGTTSISQLTDKDGSYSFPGLCPGRYMVGFASPNNHFVTFDSLGVSASADSDIDPVTGVAILNLTPGTIESDVSAGFVECDLNFIDGEFAFCNTDEAFSQDYSVETHGTLGTYTWSVATNPSFPASAGASIPTAATSNAATVLFAAGTGAYIVTFEYRLNAADVDPACTRSFDVHIVDDPDFTLACNNLVNLSLDANCMLEVRPDMLLEGQGAIEGGFSVELFDVEGDTLLPSNMAGYEYAAKTLVGKVTHVCTGNSCWGNINVEDKNIPELSCSDVTVSCGDNISPILAGVTTFNFAETFTTDQGDVFNTNVNWPVLGNGCATVLGNNCYTIDASSLCGPSTLCYEDVIGEVDCADTSIGQVVTRTWTITTPSGSSTTCTEEISFSKPNLADLVFPGNFTGDDALDCRFAVTSLDSILGPNYWLTLPDGNPDPNTPNHDLYPSGLQNSCERLKASYSDQRFGDCDGSYKLQRTWVVIDWCTSEIVDHVQIIEVAQRGSIVLNIPNEFDVPAVHDCTSAFDAPAPNIIFPGCSKITSIQVGYRIVEEGVINVLESFTFTGVTENADGTYRIPKVDGAGSQLWIGYVVMNECGQMTEGFTEANFVDAKQPVAVCDQETVVSLNSDGEAWASPESFDDGSRDNCGLSHLEVMKIGGEECGEPRAFARKIKFCCADVGQKVEVHVKAIDNAGFENICKSWVEVQDNFAPVLISCPPDMVADCNIDPMNLSGFGSPEFDGVCDISISADTTVNINDCGIGTIRRVWRGVNSKGAEKTCEQIISVGRANPFDEDDINWPDNFDGDGCYESTDLDPRNLPESTGVPIINDVNCSKISYDYEDTVLSSEESCIKIIRQWTVLDWCQYTDNTNTGVFIHNQVIKLSDTVDPTITSGCGSMNLDGPGLNDNCQVDLDLVAAATDNCTPAGDLRWSHVVRNVSTGDERTGAGNDASGSFGIGNYTITWTVRDNCDNEVSCDQTVSIVDTKAPTPYCLGDIVTTLNQSTKMVTVWASDFSTGSADNCGPKNNTVDIAFSEDRSDTNITVDCSMFTSSRHVQPVKIYAIDAAGNFSYCESKLIVQDNHDLCELPVDDGTDDTTGDDGNTDGGDDTTDSGDTTGDDTTGGDDDTDGDDNTGGDDMTGSDADTTSADGSAIIAGHIFTIDNQMVDGVEVNAYSDEAAYHASFDTDQSGTFAFPELEMYKDYMLEASKSDSYTNGVSTLDIVLIQRHILGLKALDSPFKVIAADANNSGSISASDLVLLRRLILGMTEELPHNESWRFVEQEQEFLDVNNPFPFNEQIEYYDLQTNEMKADFVAVKIGDVNNTVSVNNLRSTEVRSGAKRLIVKAPLTQGEIMMVPFYAESIETLTGLQFTLDLGRSLTYKGVSAKQIKVNESHVGIKSNNEITLSWNATQDDIELDADQPLFYLILESKDEDASAVRQIQMNSRITKAEIYTSVEEIFELELEHEFEATQSIASESFKVYQNVPNPFSNETSIKFYLPQAEDVTLRLIDITGKIVMTNTAAYAKGQNEITVNVKDINTQGVLYYQLETQSNIANMKMIVLK